MKIGQIALIAFILLVAVVVCFLLLMCCMYCPTLFGGGYRGQPQPETGGYYPTNIQGIQGIIRKMTTWKKSLTLFLPAMGGISPYMSVM